MADAADTNTALPAIWEDAHDAMVDARACLRLFRHFKKPIETDEAV